MSTRARGGGGARGQVASGSVRPKTWNELSDCLFADSWREPLKRFRSRFAYRGMHAAPYELTTSLAQLSPEAAEREPQLLRNFRKFAGRDGLASSSIWEWLALAQHHGLPTRLLDWSFSPFVALHFATADPATFGSDGVIWCIDYVGAHRLLPRPLRQRLRRDSADVFTTEMLDGEARTVEHLDALSARPFLLFFDPPSLDMRIVNQFALFSLMSDPSAQLPEWVRAHPELVLRIEIPSVMKWEIRDRLDQANITERVLFPGLDGLSSWLARYYAPRTTEQVAGPAWRPPRGARRGRQLLQDNARAAPGRAAKLRPGERVRPARARARRRTP